MPFYVSPEQAMKDKADLRRKGIARAQWGRAAVATAASCSRPRNPSTALHKISEIYNRIASPGGRSTSSRTCARPGSGTRT